MTDAGLHHLLMTLPPHVGGFLFQERANDMSDPLILNAPVYEHGFVTGRYLTAVADGPTQATGH